MAKSKQSLWQILFEFLSIVFAVLLALGLNSFKQNLDLKSESEVLTLKILKEVKRNATEMDSVVISNKEYLAYLDSLLEVEDVKSLQFSIASELMSSSAWKFTQSSNSFTFIDGNFLDDATELYEQQDYYMLISNQMFQNLGQMIIRVDDLESQTMVQTAHYYLSNILETATNLQENYNEFLKNYEQKSNSSD